MDRPKPTEEHLLEGQPPQIRAGVQNDVSAIALQAHQSHPPQPSQSPFKPSPWTEPIHEEIRQMAAQMLRREKAARPKIWPSTLSLEIEEELAGRFPNFEGTAALHDLVCDAGDIVWPEWAEGIRSLRSYDTYEECQEQERRQAAARPRFKPGNIDD